MKKFFLNKCTCTYLIFEKINLTYTQFTNFVDTQWTSSSISQQS